MFSPDLIKLMQKYGFERIDFKSPQILKTLILNSERKFYNDFDSVAFTRENILLLLERSASESDLSFLSKKIGNLRVADKITLIKELLRKNYYNIATSTYLRFILSNDDLRDLYYDGIGKADISLDNLNNLYSWNNDANLLVAKLFEKGRFDIISYYLTINRNESPFASDKNIALIDQYHDEIIENLNLFNFSVLGSNAKNTRLFDILFLNGYPQIINICNYVGYENIVNHIEESSEIKNKVREYVNNCDNWFLDTVFNRIESMRSDEQLLNIILERKKFSYLSRFTSSAWSISNQIQYLDLYYNENDVPRIGGGVARLIGYDFSYSFAIARNDVVSYDNINNVENFKEYKICFSIGKDVAEGKIPNNNGVTKLYKLIYDTKSINIQRLIYALLENNIENANKLYNEDGITDYFMEFLMYDYDYINSSSEQLLETNSNINYLTNIKMLLINKNMANLFHGSLHINKNNIDKYISNGSLTEVAIDKLFRMQKIDILIILIDNGYNLNINEIQGIIIQKYRDLKSDNQKAAFLNFCVNNMGSVTADNIDKIIVLIRKINYSNSFEIRKKSDSIISILLKHEDCDVLFDQLEEIFISGAAPEFLKRYVMYQLLYGDQIIKDDYSVNSPILKSVSTEEANKILLWDLFRLSIDSNSMDIISYFSILQRGFDLYKRITNPSSLSDEEKRLLHDFRIRIEFIYKHILHVQIDENLNDYEAIKSFERFYYSKYTGMGLVIPEDLHFDAFLDKLLSDLFGRNVSLAVLSAKVAFASITRIAIEEGNNIHKRKLQIRNGDYIKGVDSKFLDNIFDYGNLCQEFLGEGANRDMTHLDSDTSIITQDFSSIPDLLKQRYTANSFGDVRFVISKQYMQFFNDFIETNKELSDFSDDDKDKYEVFPFGNLNDFGFRTGIPLKYVSAIIATSRANYNNIRLLITKNSFYIPLYGEDGTLLFSYENYMAERKKMMGLSYYGIEDYELSDSLINSDIVDTNNLLSENEQDVTHKRNIIYGKLNGVFNKYFGSSKWFIDRSVDNGSVEVIDEGSTERYTNIPGDGDFDFIIRLDYDFINGQQFEDFSRDLYAAFGKPKADSKVITLKNVTIDGISTPLNIDMTIIPKHSKIVYSNDSCVRDRLNTIKEKYPDKYDFVIANIIFAKKFFKERDIYKEKDGGFSGIGIENFILQHGGSFVSAITDFIEKADASQNLTDFKQKFYIFSMGQSHLYEAKTRVNINFPYENFASSITEKSYQIMIEAFKEYLRGGRTMVADYNSNLKK